LFAVPIIPLVIKRLQKAFEHKHEIFGKLSDLPSCFCHGWMYSSHKNIFSRVISSETRAIIEIGSWYGTSTIYLAEQLLAKNPAGKLYAIDPWDERIILNDQMYGNKVEEILKEHPLYHTFLANLWNYRDHVTPFKMDSKDGLHYLKNIGVSPDVIYIDGNHYYDFVSRDIRTCLELFPNAILIGDDYGNYEDVRRAVHECALDYSKKVFVDSYMCWTYAELSDYETGVGFIPTNDTDFVSDAFAIPKERRSDLDSKVLSLLNIDENINAYALPYKCSGIERKYIYILAGVKGLHANSVGGEDGHDQKYVVVWKNSVDILE